jgi:hypothetical protein
MIMVGTLITLKSEWLFQNFGSIAFFDKYFHTSGGGRFGYKIMGVLGTFLGILVLTNIHRNLLLWVASLFVFGGPSV